MDKIPLICLECGNYDKCTMTMHEDCESFMFKLVGFFILYGFITIIALIAEHLGDKFFNRIN